MLQLNLLNRRAAGNEYVARRFPVFIGRAPDAHLRLELEGVWDRHARILLHPKREFVIEALADATLLVNGHPVTTAPLRNGDVIQLGAAQLRFSLSPTQSRQLKFREVLTWTMFVALCVGQILLVNWLSWLD